MLTREEAHKLVHQWARSCLMSHGFVPKDEFEKMTVGRTSEEKALLFAARGAIIRKLHDCECGEVMSGLEQQIYDSTLREGNPLEDCGREK